VFDYKNTSIESVGVSLLSGLYPTALLCVMTLVNHAQIPAPSVFGFNSNLFILLIFVISPIADSFAYLFGCGLGKKFPKKMSPNISPNKTMIGGIGGLFGGLVGACAVYFIYNAVAGSYADMQIWLPVYLAIGLLVALFTAFGDLMESAIKRKVGIKDMGKIMPGHGGALDRIDGSIYASLVVYLCFILVGALV
jgi:phosphatidate cytidylyltransferase